MSAAADTAQPARQDAAGDRPPDDGNPRAMPRTDAALFDGPPLTTPADDANPRLCVLASGSSGNCSVLITPKHPGSPLARGVTLIDCGLSPRRTFRLLAAMGIRPDEIDDILLTHLDTDHCHPGWASVLNGEGRHTGCRATLRIARRHLGRAERDGLLRSRCEPFEPAPFDLSPRLRVCPIMMSHDALGVAAFRFDFTPAGGAREHPACSLGFATDLGRVTAGLVDHLRGVDVLAIESNYCPRLQRSSARPAFLKQRIMGGSGHLSNEEAAEAADLISPREHAVFLHLSRECNRPELVSALHAGARYGHTITSQFRPSRWVPVRPGPRPTPRAPGRVRLRPLCGDTLPLFA